MNTSKILPLGGTVNVTIHKNYLTQDDSSYAKVQRTTAGMNNVIQTASSALYMNITARDASMVITLVAIPIVPSVMNPLMVRMSSLLDDMSPAR